VFYRAKRSSFSGTYSASLSLGFAVNAVLGYVDAFDGKDTATTRSVTTSLLGDIAAVKVDVCASTHELGQS
jgi:hypothetical protein